MMGERRVMQEALFYGFSLERHVPDDHLLRKVAGSSTCPRFERTWAPTIATSGDPRSIPN